MSDLLATLRRLNDPAARDQLGLFVIERYTAFVRAVDTGAEIVGVIACKRLLTSALCQMLVRRTRNAGIPTLYVDPETFRRHQLAARASGVIAIVRQRWRPLSDVSSGAWLAVDRLRAPGNLGCILRTAEAAGLRGVLCVGADPYDPEVVGASLGGLFGLTFVRASWSGVREACQGRLPLVAATPSGDVAWDEWAWPDAHVLCLGEERAGLPHDLLRACDARVRIPILGAADSLNVATAAGILVYEGVRRRLARETPASPSLLRV